MRTTDWVDRLAGIDTLAPQTYADAHGFVLYPIGLWVTWPAWRRLADLLRARVVGTALAALSAAQYRVVVNPSNRYREEGGYCFVTAGEAFEASLAMRDIALLWCAACDDPAHGHGPQSRPTIRPE